MFSLLAESIDMVDRIANLGGLGVCVALLFYLHTSGMTAMRDELRNERERHDESLKAEREIFKDSLADLVRELKVIVERIETVEEKIDRIKTS